MDNQKCYDDQTIKILKWNGSRLQMIKDEQIKEG